MTSGPYLKLALALAVLGLLGGCLGQTHQPVPRPSVARAVLASALLRSQVTADGVELETSSGSLHVSAPRSDTFRIRFARSKAAHGLPSFAIEPGVLGSTSLKVEESDTLLLLKTADALLRVDKKPFGLRLMDAAGSVIVGDIGNVIWQEPGLSLELSLAEDEHVYGLGDKVRGFDRRGQRFELWNADAFAWKVDTDPLYKALPFLLFLKQGRAHGLFKAWPGFGTT